MTTLDAIHALGIVVLGALGWFSLEFLGRPIREFVSLRQETRRLMLLHWDDPSAEDLSFYDDEGDPRYSPEEWDQARNAFSEIAARLGAFDQGEPFASWLVRTMGFNLPKAAGNLRHLGSCFGARGENREEVFKKIDGALKFRANPNKPTFYSPHHVGH